MNQDKYTRLLETLEKCQFPDAQKHVNEFKLFMKNQQLNNKIDTMIDDAHKKKISDEEFAAMIEEQKQIMRDLGVTLKEPPSPVKKPNISRTINTNLPEENKEKNIPKIENKKVESKGNTKIHIGDSIKIYNMNEVANYVIDSGNFLLFDNKEEKIEKVKLDSGEVVNLSQATPQQKDLISETLSEDESVVELPPILNDELMFDNKKLVPSTPKKEVVKPKKEVLKPKKEVLKPKKEVLKPKKEVLKPKKEVLKPKKENKVTKKKRTKRGKYNKYWYHQLPEYAMKNRTKVKGKRKRLTKKKPKDLVKPLPEVSKIPFRGLFDVFKI